MQASKKCMSTGLIKFSCVLENPVKNRPRILFSTPVLKHPAVGGPYLRIENSIKALFRIADLYIYSRVALNEATAVSFYRGFCHEFYFAPSVEPQNRHISFPKRIVNRFARKLIRKNLFNDVGEPEFDFRGLLDVADAINADLIWLGYGNISYPLLKYIKSYSSYKVVLDTDSVWSRFILRGLPFATSEEERQNIEKAGREKEQEEKWGTQLADVTTAVSQVDADYYIKLAKYPQQIHLFSNVIDIESYKKPPPPPDEFKNPSIYLAGTFWHGSPMEDAARWVIKEVLPLVRQHIPNIHLYIAGRGSNQTLSDINDSGITITGELPSVLPYLCHAGVALVPLRFESGTRFKILEAGACGIPVVSTTLGAEGIPVTHEKDILIADEPESFANSIVRVIKDPGLAKKIAGNLKELVCEEYSVPSLAQQASLILGYLNIRTHSTRTTNYVKLVCDFLKRFVAPNIQ